MFDTPTTESGATSSSSSSSSSSSEPHTAKLTPLTLTDVKKSTSREYVVSPWSNGIKFTPEVSMQNGAGFEDITDQVLLADNEKLRKIGRVGKFIATHRKNVTRLAVVLLVLGALALVWAFGNALYYSWVTVAAGVNYFKPTDVVVLPHNKLRVLGVHQPTMSIQTSAQAYMVIEDARNDTGARRTLRAENVKAGYYQWRVARGQPLHNFTFTGLESAMRREKHAYSNCSCLCVIDFGVALSGAFLLTEDLFVYEPKFLSSINVMPRTDYVVCDAPAHKLFAHWREQIASSAASGKVEFITSAGNLRQRIFSPREFGCLKDCASYFE